MQYTILQAAVRHAQRLSGRQDPRLAVFDYLTQWENVTRRAGKYDLSYQATLLKQSIERLGSVNAVRKHLRATLGITGGLSAVDPTPASNTGVTPLEQSILEDYIRG